MAKKRKTRKKKAKTEKKEKTQNRDIIKNSAKKPPKKLGKKRKILKVKLTTKHKKIFNIKNLIDEKIKKLKRGNKLKIIEKDHKFIYTGHKTFDSLFEPGYGVPVGSSVLIEGGPGSGKTIFCLAMINEFCRQGKKCLYMSFEEPEERLIGHMELFNWPVRDYIKKGLLKIKRFDAIDVSRSVEALLSAAKKELLIEVDPVLFPTDFDPDFVAIDSLTSIASAFSGQESRFRIYMEQLFRYLEKNMITTFLVREVATPTHIGSTFKEEGEAVSFLSDGIVILYNVIYDTGKRGFALEILKMRGSSFKRKIVLMEIKSGQGIVLHTNKILKREKQKGFSLT